MKKLLMAIAILGVGIGYSVAQQRRPQPRTPKQKVAVHQCYGSCARTGTLTDGRPSALQTTVPGPLHSAQDDLLPFVDGITGVRPSGRPGPTGPCT
jgi:hypothetical protein